MLVSWGKWFLGSRYCLVFVIGIWSFSPILLVGPFQCLSFYLFLFIVKSTRADCVIEFMGGSCQYRWMVHSSPQSRFHPPTGTNSMDKLSLRPLVLSKKHVRRSRMFELIDLQAIVSQSSRDAEIWRELMTALRRPERFRPKYLSALSYIRQAQKSEGIRKWVTPHLFFE